jgi:hypothetical protein
VKRTAIARSTPLARTGGPQRRTRLAPKRATPRRSSRVEAPHYLAWLREQPCGVPFILKDAAGPCGGPVDPEHKREGVGMGQKASDMDAWACCRIHHDQRHDGRGVFSTMTRDELRTFIRMQIAMFKTAYTAHLATLPRNPAPSDEVGLTTTAAR